MKSVVAFRVIFLFPLGRFLAMMNKDETKKKKKINLTINLK